MKGVNINQRIRQYTKVKPDLAYDQLGTLLTIDSMYSKVPEDIKEFRQLYPLLNPFIIGKSTEGIIFLEIAGSKEPNSVIKHRLNSYINLKYNYLDNFQSYEKNMKRFREDSIHISQILDDILKISQYPDEIIETLREREAVKRCYDFCELLALYKRSKSRRLRFEIMRKLALIVTISRISRNFVVDEIDNNMVHIKNVFHKGLGLAKRNTAHMYLWVDEKDRVHHSYNRKEAQKRWETAKDKRESLALPTYPLQTFEHNPYKTKFGSSIIHMEMRNKLRTNGHASYTSFLEKMFRKNLQFPKEVHDIIGVKFVVNTEAEIPQLIKDLETFLGGTSTRKREKNSLHNFGKRKLGKFSAKNYYVWKAVYDIAIPPQNVNIIEKVMALNRRNKVAMDNLKKMLESYKNKPQDVIVEVQLQDLQSYLRNIAKGNPAEHSMLKMKQVRLDSFYKFFPKEIYNKSLISLRKRLLK